VRRRAIFVIRRRWWIIAVALVALPLFALYGGGVHDKLSTGGFADPSAESSRAAAITKQFRRRASPTSSSFSRPSTAP